MEESTVATKSAESAKPEKMHTEGSSRSVMDVVAPPQPSSDEDVKPHEANKIREDSKTNTKAESAQQSAPSQERKKPAKSPKQSAPNVGLAIAATVIIVLGLAVLATFAFLKTNNQI